LGCFTSGPFLTKSGWRVVGALGRWFRITSIPIRVSVLWETESLCNSPPPRAAQIQIE
jgi:hypothetical protein